jgi:2-methylisocitrate lyase-like PEP mutase family enzyme
MLFPEACRGLGPIEKVLFDSESIPELSQYAKFAEALPGVPILANITEFGQTPLFSAKELAEAGVSVTIINLVNYIL